MQAGLHAQRVQTGYLVQTQVQCLHRCQICGHRRPRFGLLLDHFVARVGRGYGSSLMEEHEREEVARFPGVTSLKFANQIHSLKFIFKTYCKNLSFEFKLLCHLIFTMHLIYIQLPFLLHFLIKLVSFSSP